MKNRKFLILLTIGALLATTAVLAEDQEKFPWESNVTPSLTLPTTPIEGAVKRIANVIFYATALIALIMVVWGGLTMATAAGDPGKVDLARHMILYALIAIAVGSIAWGLVSLVATYVAQVK